MSNTELGKKFEGIFAKDWKKCFPNTFFFRLKDQVSGYKEVSQNPCDFLAMNNGYMWMLECKETKEGTINFSKIPQLDRLKDYIGIQNVQTYILVWFSSFDKVIACPAKEALKMRADGKKSISLKMLEDKSYYIIDLPSEKKIKFLETNYRYLIEEQVINECKTRECFK